MIVTQVKQGDGTNATPAIPYAGFEHFGLGVRDIDKVAAELKAKGVEFTRVPARLLASRPAIHAFVAIRRRQAKINSSDGSAPGGPGALSGW